MAPCEQRASPPAVPPTTCGALQVIGDGAITGGMAYEAMNHAGFLDTNMIVILNDNQQVRCSADQAANSPSSKTRQPPVQLHRGPHLPPPNPAGGSHACAQGARLASR